MDKCPHCGWDDDFYFNEYHIMYKWCGVFNKNGGDIEMVDSYHKQPPVYGFCGRCNKRFKLRDI